MAGRAFFISDSLTLCSGALADGRVPCILLQWADNMAGSILREYIFHFPSVLFGGSVAMGGFKPFALDGIVPMLALSRLRWKGLLLTEDAAKSVPKQVEMGRAARGLGTRFRFSCERDLAAFR